MADNKFTHNAQCALMLSFAAAKRLSHNFIGSEHILLGIANEKTGSACRALLEEGLDDRTLESKVKAALGEGNCPSRYPLALSESAARIIEGAVEQALMNAGGNVGSDHLLLAILNDKQCGAARILQQSGADFSRMYGKLSMRGATLQRPKLKGNELKLTLQFGEDMTLSAQMGKYDPVYGREQETERMVQILTRRQKCNPVLLGGAGVGKTAIVENLAQRVAAGQVPAAIADKRIVALNLASMISGTKYRGEFESRVCAIVDEVKTAGNVILFIDEIHMIAGAGAAEGAIDAANILKPALARGQIQIIGASTPAEYKKYIEKDSALERRFQPFQVCEPTAEQAKRILLALKDKYEKHHGVLLGRTVVDAAVDLSRRYLPERYLPDKAIDLIDESMAHAALHHKRAVDKNDVSAVLSQMTGIDTSALKVDEKERLKGLPAQLRKRVIGQEEAVRAVAKAVLRGRAFGRNAARPMGVFLFCGPSGVGKTELAKALAAAVFGDEHAMIRLDMSEYMEKHSVSRLIGSPPGYVGFGEGGQLTEKIRRAPYSVVLFDELEKAHPDVLNLLLQMLEDGVLTDSEGRTVSFQSAIVIMTSNVGLEKIANSRVAGFGAGEQGLDSLQGDVMRELKKAFRPELLGRIDEIITFHALGQDELRGIAGKMMDELRARLEPAGLKVTWDERAIAALLPDKKDAVYGARPLRKAITTQVEDLIAERWIAGEIGDEIQVTAEDGAICLRQPGAAQKPVAVRAAAE